MFLSKTTQIPQGNNVLHAPASNIDDFLYRRYMFNPLSSIGLFGKNRAHLHLEKPML
jgi:hypothetical protein